MGLANGANQYLLASMLFFISILFIRKLIFDKNIKNNITGTSTNILQIQSNKKNFNFEKIINELTKNVNYLRLKSLTSDKDGSQYNFWFDVDKKKLPAFLKNRNISTNNKDISVQIYSGLEYMNKNSLRKK